MSKSVITDSLLTDIADAIREQTGKTATMTPSEMAVEIASISGGVEGGSTTPKELAYLLINKTLSGNTALFPDDVPLVDFGPVVSLPQSYFLKNSTGGSTNGFGMNTNVSKIVCPNLTYVKSNAMQYNTDAAVSGSTRALREAYFPVCKSFESYACSSWGYACTLVLGAVESIGNYAFQGFGALAAGLEGRTVCVYINSALGATGDNAFANAGISQVYFTGNTVTSGRNMSMYTFKNCTGITDIYVPWTEGAVNSAPWGATNATIHYETQTEPPEIPTA